MGLKKILDEIFFGIFKAISDIFRMFFRTYKKNIAVITVFLVVLISLTIFALTVPFLAKDRSDQELYKIEIPQGASASRIAQILYSGKMIQSRLSFKIFVSLFGFGSELKAGIYYLSPSMDNAQIVSIFASGRAAGGEKRVTIPEGSSIYKIARILERNNIKVTDGDVEYLATSGLTDDLRLKYPFLSQVPTRSLEGYLFPDTYLLPPSIGISRLTEMMLDRFSQVAIPVFAHSKAGKYDLHQILTLASIVEKESQKDEERPMVSSVFHNRLDRGIALRADPTVKYILENPTKRVFFADLKTDSPYNTYLYRGLPPGPICSPGLASIKAALEPARTDYLYFVSNGDGTHTFSRTWEEHSQAAERFRRGR